MSKFTLKHFIRKFESIPEEKWFVGDFRDYQTGAKCALGHCGVVGPEVDALQSIFAKYGTYAQSINDKEHILREKFPRVADVAHQGPKQRILAALKWIAKQKRSKKVIYRTRRK